MSPGGELIHKEFLGETLDCQKALAEQLCQDIPMDGTPIAYNMTFEKTVLLHLSEQFPNLKEHLLAIRENLLDIRDHMVDLLVPFKKGFYYHVKQGGSNSIKYVMPALCPDMAEAYHELPVVHNGGEASDTFKRMGVMSPEELAQSREQLLKYCGLDTFALVKLWEKLLEVTQD